MGDVGHEQSMEEILSSIKRIIAEDSEASLSTPRPKRSIAPTVQAPQPAPEPEVLELTEAVPAEPKAEDIPVAQPAPVEAAAKPALVSDEAVLASRTAIAALSALVVKPEVTGSDTLEGLVREMIRPMLTEWLDAKLPDIVERLVAQEIRRITDRG